MSQTGYIVQISGCLKRYFQQDLFWDIFIFIPPAKTGIHSTNVAILMLCEQAILSMKPKNDQLHCPICQLQLLSTANSKGDYIYGGSLLLWPCTSSILTLSGRKNCSNISSLTHNEPIVRIRQKIIIVQVATYNLPSSHKMKTSIFLKMFFDDTSKNTGVVEVIARGLVLFFAFCNLWQIFGHSLFLNTLQYIKYLRINLSQ